MVKSDMSPTRGLPAKRIRVEMASATPVAQQEELNFDLRRKMCTGKCGQVWKLAVLGQI